MGRDVQARRSRDGRAVGHRGLLRGDRAANPHRSTGSAATTRRRRRVPGRGAVSSPSEPAPEDPSARDRHRDPTAARSRSTAARPSPARPPWRPADPRPPDPQRHRRERPSRRRRRGRRGRPDRAPARRSGPRRHPALVRQAVRRCSPSSRPAGSRRSSSPRPRSRSWRARTPARTSTSGRSRAMYRRAGVTQTVARLRIGGHAARRADGGAARARRREGRPGPPHVLGPALGVAPPGAAARLAARGLLAGRPPRPGRVPGERRGGIRNPARPARHRDRRVRRRRPTRSRSARSPAPTRSSPIRRPCRRADPRAALGAALTIIRDAMLAHPEMVGGTRDRLDTSLMKVVPGRVVSKGGMEALRGLAMLAGAAARQWHRRERGHGNGDQDRGRRRVRPRDLGGHHRGRSPGRCPRRRSRSAMLARYHRPAILDPHGRVGAEAIAEFELAPVGELIG